MQCFYQAGSGDHGAELTSLTINNSVEEIAENAFYEYGGSTLNEVSFAKMESNYNSTFAKMGFSTSGKPQLIEDFDKDGV